MQDLRMEVKSAERRIQELAENLENRLENLENQLVRRERAVNNKMAENILIESGGNNVEFRIKQLEDLTKFKGK